MDAFDLPDISWPHEQISHELASLRSQLDAREKACQALEEELKDLRSSAHSSDQLFRDVFAHVPIGLVINDIGGRFLHVNEAYCRITGYSVEELLRPDFKFQRLTHPDDLENNLDHLRRLLAGEIKHFNIEKRYIRKDGGIVWVRASASLRKGPTGLPLQLLGFVEDINEHKLVDVALRKSEQKFRLFFNAVSDPIYIGDMQGNIIEVNEIACRQLGYSRDELLHMTVMDIDAPQFAQMALQRIREARETDYFVFESVHRRRDGMQFPVEINICRIQYKDQPCVLGVVRDISERKRSEEMVRAREERLRAFVTATSDVVYTMSSDWNEMRQLQGRDFILDTDEPSGTWLEKYIDPDDQPQVLSAINEAIRTKSIFELVHRVLRVDGTLGWAWSRAVPVLDANGGIVEWIGAAKDITERKRSREELQRLNETLEQRVADRTRQLRTMAVQLIEAEERERHRISQLLHDDLQQMLAAAKLQLQTACDNLPSEPMLTNVGLILEESIAKARRLSHELSPAVLHYSGLAAGFRWLAGQMKEQFGFEVELGVEASRQFDQASMKVFIFRAVQELLFNTVKHAGVKCARVTIESSEESLITKVIDHGCGFDPHAQQGADKKAGFGLLSIKERAAHIGGSLEIESAPGKGSCFTLTVPRRLEVEEEQETQRYSPDIGKRPQNKSRPKKSRGNVALRILFCDDHHVMRHGLVQLMNKQPGIQVVGEAADGVEAVNLCRELRPDVVVMDISLPKIDGIEATRRIKAEQPQVRIIGLSMHENEDIFETMRAAGADSFVSKTAVSAELLKAIYGMAPE